MKMFIGGQQTDAADQKVIEIINPATFEVIDTVPNANIEDLECSLNYAQEGKCEWSNTPLYKRSNILLKYVAKVNEHSEELAEILCKETGKTIKNSLQEIKSIAGIITSFVERANHLYGISMPDNFIGTENDVVFTRREPLGVVLCVIPFNYPASTFAYKVAPALAVGNAVIIKPPSDNPLTIMRLTELLIEAGVPGNAAQVVTGSGSKVGKYLVGSHKIDAVSLTGSTDVGIDTAKAAAQNLHKLHLELGGNDAIIICEDADIDLAVKEVIASRITNAGQICIATKRIIIQKTIKEDFTKKLIDKISNLKVGDPLDPSTDIGCLINEKAAIEVENQVNHTIKQGAKCIYGGKRFSRTFFEPTILTEITSDMDVAKDMEIFGPVFSIIEFDDIDEAINIHNSTRYGLNGGIMTRDISKAMKTAVKLQCGEVVINGAGYYRNPAIAFGGYKMSGIGREGASATLEELTQVKTIIMKRILK